MRFHLFQHPCFNLFLGGQCYFYLCLVTLLFEISQISCLDRPASDVAISGLGWIAIEPKRKSLGISDNNFAETIKELHLAVGVPRPVEIFVRPPIPVGKAGAEWYQYRELTEKEEEVRPKWYF